MTTEVIRLLPVEWAEYFSGDIDADEVRYAPEELQTWLFHNGHLQFVQAGDDIGTSDHHVPEFAGEYLQCYRFLFTDTSVRRHSLAAKKKVVVGNAAKLPLPKVPA